MNLGLRLKARAEVLGITQTDLAKELGISLSTLNGYFTGYRESDVRTITLLAEKLQTTTDSLLTGEEKEKPPAQSNELNEVLEYYKSKYGANFR